MIYILEDDDSIRKLVTYALESQGYSAAGFAVPSAFYEELEKRVPSLLLLDIMLPEEDGTGYPQETPRKSAHGRSSRDHADSQEHGI